MIIGQSRSSQNPFERAPAFHYGARLADRPYARADATPANPSLYPARGEEQSRRHSLNWGLIGGILFSALCWWALFTFASPAIRSMLAFLSNATP